MEKLTQEELNGLSPRARKQYEDKKSFNEDSNAVLSEITTENPNIEVVVNNQGTPKDAQANVKPQLDVNKMVVEIVTSDLRNNGPIRKSLRGNA